MARNGKIWLSKNIKMDKNYKSVLNYTESQLLELMTNQSNLVYHAEDYSFIREKGTIQINCPYNIAIQSNYMAFQNPSYSGKYFFAFIDEVNFLSQNSSEIKYTLDVWSTWFEYWNPTPCFVLREHVVDDSIGVNTVPESLELGEYISVQNPTKMLYDTANDFYIAMAVTGEPDGSLASNDNHIYNGLYSGLTYFICQTPTDCTNVIKQYDKMARTDYIYAIFIVPKNLSSIRDGQWSQWTLGNITANVCYLANSDDADTTGILNGTFPNHIGKNYIPKNKKLYTHPFSYMVLDNNSGISQPFFYEDFDQENNVPVIGFWIDACLSIGMSMKAIPLFYKNININYAYGIALGKLPICSWVSDVFTNWLTQNSLNMAVDYAGNFLQIATGKVASGVTGIANSLAQEYQRSLVPYQSKGNLGSGDVNFSDINDGGITLHYMSVRDEFAERIDQYFTRMGYAVNKIKLPNMSNRENYNYVQVAQEENVAYPNNHNNICLPATALNLINTLFRNGVTIWNNHANFGDYSVTNAITS